MADTGNPALDSLTQAEKVKRLFLDSLTYRNDINVAIGEELDFSLKLKHYLDDQGETKSTERIQPKGRELIGKIRHKSAEITDSLYITCKPVDQSGDPQSAEFAKWVLEYDVKVPSKDYAQVREDWVTCAISARLGVIALDYVPGIGAFGGEIIPRIVDPRLFFWTPGWKSPHDPTCPWVIEARRMRVEDVRRMQDAGWKNTGEIKGDAGMGGIKIGDPSMPPGVVRFQAGSSGNPEPGTTDVEPRVTVLLFWGRLDDTRTEKAKNHGLRRLRPDQRYMICKSCGMEDRGQEGSDLPKVGGLCPDCLQQGATGPDGGSPQMQRVDAEIDTEEVLAYPHGRLTIVAPFQGNDAQELYDDNWPFKIRSVPYGILHGYPHPLEQIGMSDTAYDWSLQLITDALLRQAYEQMSDNRDLTILPIDNLFDEANEPYQMSKARGAVAYWRGQGMPNAMHFQGSGLPQGWREMFGQVQSVLMRDMGTSDISVGSEQTRNIPVGTVRALQETGEIPVDHHKRRLWRAESMILSVWLDMIRDTWTEKRLIRINPENGSSIFKSLQGSDIPNADVEVSAAPAIGNVDAQEIQALQQVFNSPPPQMKIMARKLNVPPSDIAQYLAEMQKYQQEHPPQPKPADPAAVLVAISDILKVAPDYVSFNQVQQALSAVGIQPAQGMDQSQQIMHGNRIAKQMVEALPPPTAVPSPPVVASPNGGAKGNRPPQSAGR